MGIIPAAHGGQILLSAAVTELIKDSLPEGVSLRALGSHRLKDLSQAQTTLKMVLDGRYDVRSCFTGMQGAERVEQDDPDVVLLDINLPDQDGFDVLTDIKSIPSAPPVIMLTLPLLETLLNTL